jgi:hypothetical protein
LIQIISEPTDKPVALMRAIQRDVIDRAKPFFQMRDFDVIAEVCSGISLPKSTDYAVKIKIADFELVTKGSSFVGNCYNRWLTRFP